MRWLFVPDNTDKEYFAVASIALAQEPGVPFAVVSYNEQQTPNPAGEFPPETVRKVEIRSLLEFAVLLSPPISVFTPLLQTDKRWTSGRLGEGGETIGRSGCFVVSLAMMLQDVYGRLVLPDALADVLTLTRDSFVGDFLDWRYVISQLSLLTNPMRRNGTFEPKYVQSLIEREHKIIVANPKITHFVYLLGVVGNRYKVADPMVGVTEWRAIGGIRSAKRADARPFEGPYALYVD